MFRETLENLGRSPSAEKHVRIMLPIEAREGPNTQDKAERLMAATGHLFEDMMATCHPPGIAGEAAGESSNTKWAFRQLRKKYGVELHQRHLNSVFMTVGDADTPGHPEFFSAVTFESQRLTKDGATVDRSHDTQHGDVRIGEPRETNISVLIPLTPRTQCRLAWHVIAWSKAGIPT